MRRKLLLPLVVIGIGIGIGVWAILDEDNNIRRPHLTPQALPTATCPDGVRRCRSVRGRVILVERVDPDGDGDLHVVIAGRHGVTAPGVSAIDISKKLRPERDPRIGDSVSAAGPVGRGSHGQAQVAALELHVVRR